MLGLAYGAIGTAIAIGIALYRYHTVRLPPVSPYPGAILNAIATAFVDEAVFRGPAVRLPAHDRPGAEPRQPDPGAALRARDAARGARAAVVHAVAALVIGLAGGWLTGITGGIGAAFLGHSITRVAIFLDHRPRRDPEGAREPRPRRSRGGRRRPRAGTCSGRARRPGTASDDRSGARVGSDHRPGGRRSRSTSTCRSASRCARTATSSCTRVRRRGGRRRGSRRSSARC